MSEKACDERTGEGDGGPLTWQVEEGPPAPGAGSSRAGPPWKRVLPWASGRDSPADTSILAQGQLCWTLNHRTVR